MSFNWFQFQFKLGTCHLLLCAFYACTAILFCFVRFGLWSILCSECRLFNLIGDLLFDLFSSSLFFLFLSARHPCHFHLNSILTLLVLLSIYLFQRLANLLTSNKATTSSRQCCFWIRLPPTPRAFCSWRSLKFNWLPTSAFNFCEIMQTCKFVFLP